MELAEVNAMPADDAMRVFLDCCGSREWAAQMTEARPFESRDVMLVAADRIWKSLRPVDWMEAFRAHPRIGEKRAHGQSDEAAAMSTSEQSAFERTSAGRETMRALNEEYEKRFGHLFIVCASGLAAAEIETQVRSRMTNSPEQEVRVAAEEQRKITRLRLERMLEDQ